MRAYEKRFSDCSSDVCSSDPGTIDAGATLLLAPMFDPAMPVRVIERERPGFVFGVPTMLVALADEAERSRCDVPSFQRKIGRASCRARVCHTCRSRWSASP